MGDIKNVDYKDQHSFPPGHSEFRLKSDEVFDAELSAKMVKYTDKLNDNTIDLALRLKQAREFMAWSCSHIRSIWLDWQDESNQIARKMNEFRMAFERESKTIQATGKDLTEFFNSPEYLKAHATLKETSEMLNRFSDMKKDGTLDALADFILKIKCS